METCPTALRSNSLPTWHEVKLYYKMVLSLQDWPIWSSPMPEGAPNQHLTNGLHEQIDVCTCGHYLVTDGLCFSGMYYAFLL